MHQQASAVLPDLECQLALVGVAYPMVARLGQCLVECLVHCFTRATLHRQAHDALQQASVLSQVRVVHLVNFVAAVVIVIERQQAGPQQQQQHHPPQGALAQRAHALASTR
ncbi:hypothetical protein D3C79_907170 [compost metagenome]